MKNWVNFIINILILLLVIVAPYNSYTQNAEVIIDLETYEKAIKEIPFDKTKKGLWPKPRKKSKKPKKEKEHNNKSSLTWFDNLGLSTVIAYILIFLIVCFLLYIILSNIGQDKKIDPKKVSDYIEDIEEVDTEDGYAQAIKAGDFRGAIRMHFLKVLQILTRKETIDWQPEKTNRDYIKEINDGDKKRAFQKLARIYENVWYGNHAIDKFQFDELDFHFNKFIKNEN